MSSFNGDHIVYYRPQVTSKKEVGLFQVSESIVMGGEKHRLKFRQNFKGNWKNPQTSVHSLLKWQDLQNVTWLSFSVEIFLKVC